VENTDIGKFLRDYLSVDVEEITKELVEKMDLGPLPKGLGIQVKGDEAEAQTGGSPGEWMVERPLHVAASDLILD
jgi:alkaline phosphatase